MFFLVLVDELVVDVLFLFDQVQDVGDVFFEEFVFGVGLGLHLAAESGLDELCYFLVVQVQVQGELLQQLDLLLLLLLLQQVRVLRVLQIRYYRLLPSVLSLILLQFAPVTTARLCQG